ncbi:MAG TPA: lysylphosphatidylglycerol synthase transmembrane domain-containing protein, partial [Acidobacteriaceae bacterium]|nr:lysylphosphatidylglycerol synthase transmembrane domain-containing protein [Acidobacteriaceae bacterium]
MKAKRWLLMAAVLLLLVLLGYLQFRTLSSFRWSVLKHVFGSILWSRIGWAVAFIYGAYVTRAFRWSIFLRPTKPATPVALLPSQFIGFTAVAILGRLGEFVRPYLVARRQQISFTSQLGVYTVERVFDLLAAAAIIAVTLSVSSSVSLLPHSEDFRRAGYLGILAAICMGAIVVAARVSGDRVAAIFGRAFGWFSKTAGRFVEEKILAFSHGLDTISGVRDLLLALFYSFATWGLIALAYVEVVHAFRVPSLASVAPAQTILLMAASLFGSVLQLPVVGGGSQLAIIHVLIDILGVNQEAATACSIVLFVVTFL